MSDGSLDDGREFAKYTYKVYQDLLKTSADSGDVETFKTVLEQFKDQYESFLAERPGYRLPILRYQIDNTQDIAERSRLELMLNNLQTRAGAIEELALARDQIIFMLSTYLLEHYLNDKDGVARKILFDTISESLPITLERLALVFDSVGGIEGADQFGWQWWDLKADGKAHWVDTHGRPNRLFCVKALQLLGPMDQAAAGAVRLPGGDNIAWLADANNNQGLIATLNDMRENPQRWEGILGEDELARIRTLEEVLATAKAAAESSRDDQLVVAPLSEKKVQEFVRSVLHSYNDYGHLKSLLRALGAFRDLTVQPAPPASRSWGYNQLDDKGAFVDDWHVSYPAWGENYGRGLAQTEDQAAFTEMVAASEYRGTAAKVDIIPAIRRELRKSKMGRPVLIQSFSHLLEYENIVEKDLFMAKYHPDCPKNAFSEVDGYTGILKIDEAEIPIFDINVNDHSLTNKVLAFDGNKFLEWWQLSPADSAADQQFVFDGIFVRVSDLNVDDERRNRILADEPAWLADQADKERYLRMRVVVNVYERFAVEVVSAESSFSLDVASESQD